MDECWSPSHKTHKIIIIKLLYLIIIFEYNILT